MTRTFLLGWMILGRSKGSLASILATSWLSSSSIATDDNPDDSPSFSRVGVLSPAELMLAAEIVLPASANSQDSPANSVTTWIQLDNTQEETTSVTCCLVQRKFAHAPLDYTDIQYPGSRESLDYPITTLACTRARLALNVTTPY